LNKLGFIDFKSVGIEKIILPVSISIYLILGLLLLHNYQYVINSDGISYMSIAQHYINGRFSYAINGYWSPLYSWLLIPFLLIWGGKTSALFANKVLALILGCFTMGGVYLLSSKLNFDIKLKAITLITLIPLTLYFAFDMTTPDLLVVLTLIFYLNFLFDHQYRYKLTNGLLTGFFGALAFLSKSYIFFFFLVHFGLSNVYYWIKFQSQRKIITKNFILGMIVFLVISGVWIFAISEKYDKFTLGTAGPYNYAVIGPESMGHPVYYEGLLQPPNEYAYSVWEDPSYLNVKSWSPFASASNFYYQLKIITNNLVSLLNIWESFSILSLIIIIMGLIAFKFSNDESKNKLTLLSLTIAIYSAGYCLILISTRYMWIINVLLLLLGIFCVKILFEKFNFNEKFYMILIFILSLSFIISPVIELYDLSGNGKDYYLISENLKTHGVSSSNIAANFSDWRDTVYLAYYLDAKYYGLTKSSSGKDLEEELRKNNIQYYFIWQNSSINIPGYVEMKNLDFNYPKVYYRTNNF